MSDDSVISCEDLWKLKRDDRTIANCCLTKIMVALKQAIPKDTGENWAGHKFPRFLEATITLKELGLNAKENSIQVRSVLKMVEDELLHAGYRAVDFLDKDGMATELDDHTYAICSIRVNCGEK